MALNQEIEKKYILREFPQALLNKGVLNLVKVEEIYQTYLALTKGQEVRVRKLLVTENGQTSEKYTHTFKKGSGMVREEIEYEIDRDIYDQLTKDKKPLYKKRTTLSDQHYTYEIDQYEHVQLEVVEVEFANELEAETFIKPAWFGDEVSGKKEFSNKKLWVSLQNN